MSEETLSVANKRFRCRKCDHVWKPRVSLKVKECPNCRCKGVWLPPIIEEVLTKVCSYCQQEKPATLEHFNRHKLRTDGLHNICKICGPKQNEDWRREHPRQMNAIRKRWEGKKRAELGEAGFADLEKKRLAIIQSNLKKETVEAYGGKCECCGESTLEFLTIDHIYGGGGKHRKSIPSGNIYRELKRLEYPKEEYRLLCMNCNFATRFGYSCPHVLNKSLSNHPILTNQEPLGEDFEQVLYENYWDLIVRT